MTPAPAATARFEVDAAIIDLDGTLLDTLGDFEAALAALLAEHGRPALARAAIARMVGKGSEHLVREALAASGLPSGLPGALAAYLRHYGRVNGTHATVFAGAAEGLAALRARGLALACVTNKPTGLARDVLARTGLAPYFAHVFGGDHFARKKPDPLPLLRTCDVLGVAPARTLVVGDSANDAAAARAAGCPVVLVPYGYNHGEPVSRVDADGIVASLADVAPLCRPRGPAGAAG